MNLHIPQSFAARAEVSTVMAAAQHIVSRQNNAPVVGAIQNTLVAFYNMTNTFETPSCDWKEEEQRRKDGGGYEAMISNHLFFDMVAHADIDFSTISDLAKRAFPWYSDFINESVVHGSDCRLMEKKTLDKKSKKDGKRRDEKKNAEFRSKEKKVKCTCSKHYTMKRLIPGKLAASIVFPKDLTWRRMTGVNPKYPEFIIENGVIHPDSAPLEKKVIGRAINSVVHTLWKYPYSPTIAETFLSYLQAVGEKFVTTVGFSMGISDCLPTDTHETDRALKEAKLECEVVNKSSKSNEEKEIEINGILNKAMSASTQLAKKGMNKKDRNALVVMKLSGAKGSDMNNGAISGFVGQQNVNGKRMPKTLAHGTKALPCILPGDNSPKAGGMVERSYLQGLEPSEVWFHAAGGRQGVVSTSLKTADVGYLQKKIAKKLEDLSFHTDGSVRNATGDIVSFLYGDDGLDPKKLVYCSFPTSSGATSGLPYPIFFNPTLLSTYLTSQAKSAQNGSEDPNSATSGLSGKIRKLIPTELDALVSFFKIGCDTIETPVTTAATLNLRKIIVQLVKNIELDENVIERFCLEVKNTFEDSKCANGEMVGLIAALSDGEVCTQLSIAPNEIITLLFFDDVEMKSISRTDRIDSLVGGILRKRCSQVFELREHSVVGAVEGKIFVMTVDPFSHVSEWKPLTEVSRHATEGNMVKVTTSSGKSITTTLSHSHLSLGSSGIICPVRGDSLRVGDSIPVFTAVGEKIRWEPITEISIIEDPHYFVYDLGVKDNNTFMISNGIFTHNTLNVFHSAGASAKDVTLGIPRLKELLSVTKNPSKPTTTIHVQSEELRVLEKRKNDVGALMLVTKFGARLACSYVRDFLKESSLKWVGEEMPKASPVSRLVYDKWIEPWWVKFSKIVAKGKNSAEQIIDPQSWIVVLKFDEQKLFNLDMTVKFIAQKIREEGLCCVASPENIAMIEIYIDFGGEVAAQLAKSAKAKLLSASEDFLVNDANIDFFVARTVVVDFVKNIYLRGVPKIMKCVPRKKPDGEWVVDAQGSNLKKILALIGVDTYRTLSDDSREISATLGIEAARKFLIREITKIISFDGTYINPRNISLLVDAMAYTGVVTSVSRDGISRDVGPLAKGMFEKTVDNFAEASAFSESDGMNGISASVMFGTVAKGGTGSVKIEDLQRMPVKRK